jgi:hypothetical protein
MKLIFVYPSNPRGDVYQITGTLGFDHPHDIVVLPDRTTRLKLNIRPGYFPIAEQLPKDYVVRGMTWKASLIFKDTESERTFENNWSQLIALINAAAAVNKLFTVHLPTEEYQRLLDGGLLDLQRKLSARAHDLLRLEDDTWNGGGPALELLRTGRCP